MKRKVNQNVFVEEQIYFNYYNIDFFFSGVNTWNLCFLSFQKVMLSFAVFSTSKTSS